MAVFFLLVGLEIKREMIDGELSTWPRRILPGVAAAGGMLIPALVYLGFQGGDPATMVGWAIPAATDIAFALGILSLLGKNKMSAGAILNGLKASGLSSAPTSTHPTLIRMVSKGKLKSTGERRNRVYFA